MDMLYFEDQDVGRRDHLGSKTVTREEIVAFASQFDPQPFHLNEDAGKRTPYGGLIASGWHTCAILMRLLADNLLANAAGMGAPGIEFVRWLKPVRPGDTLTVVSEVVQTKPSRTKPFGFVTRRFEMTNQNGETVLTLQSPGMFAKRPDSRETTP
jgi:acyl dehydratase